MKYPIPPRHLVFSILAEWGKICKVKVNEDLVYIHSPHTVYLDLHIPLGSYISLYCCGEVRT